MWKDQVVFADHTPKKKAAEQAVQFERGSTNIKEDEGKTYIKSILKV